MVFLSLGEAYHRRVSKGCLEGVWKVSETCLEGVWKVSGKPGLDRFPLYPSLPWKVLGSVWMLSIYYGGCLESTSKDWDCQLSSGGDGGDHRLINKSIINSKIVSINVLIIIAYKSNIKDIMREWVKQWSVCEKSLDTHSLRGSLELVLTFLW